MGKIKELFIGQWPDMWFTVEKTNPKYGRCISIEPIWNVTKQSIDSGNWGESEYKATYCVVCIKDGVTNTLYFNQDHPDLVVVFQE